MPKSARKATRTKTRKNAAPAIRLHKGSGQAYVVVQGTRHYCGVYADPKSHEKGLRLLAEAAAHGGALPVDPQEVTVAEVVAAFLDWAKQYYQGGTGYDAACIALAPATAAYSTAPAKSFGPLALKGIREQWIAQGLSITTINKHVSRIKRCFRWAAAEQMVTPDVPAALDCLENLRAGRCNAKPARHVGPVDDAHVDAIKPYVSRQVWALIELQRLTGARSGEVLGMRARDIDRSGEVWTVKLTSHKTAHHGKARELCFGPQAQAVLRPFLLTKRPEQTLFDPRDAERERYAGCQTHRHQPVRESQTDRTLGECYDSDSYRRAITRAIAKANEKRAEERLAPIPNWHPHQLRHALATKLREVATLDDIAATLGHSKIKMSEHYAALNHGRAVAIAAQFG